MKKHLLCISIALLCLWLAFYSVEWHPFSFAGLLVSGILLYYCAMPANKELTSYLRICLGIVYFGLFMLWLEGGEVSYQAQKQLSVFSGPIHNLEISESGSSSRGSEGRAWISITNELLEFHVSISAALIPDKGALLFQHLRRKEPITIWCLPDYKTMRCKARQLVYKGKLIFSSKQSAAAQAKRRAGKRFYSVFFGCWWCFSSTSTNQNGCKYNWNPSRPHP